MGWARRRRARAAGWLGSRAVARVLNFSLVYSHWFIIRDTIVNENQTHHLIPLYIPTIEKGRTSPRSSGIYILLSASI
eukprot:SAG31_NODE_8442_length_1451_cov_2.492604_2_plen_77_part_01